MTRLVMLVLFCVLAVAGPPAAPQPGSARRSNIVLFVPDGLRAHSVTPASAPAMAALRDRGVDFSNPHSMMPTVTMANASALATGHYLGDTGMFSNTLYSAFAVPGANGSSVPFLENDAALGDTDAHFDGDFIHEGTFLQMARAAGYHTAAVGKLGPALLFDHTLRTGDPTIVIDDATGTAAGIPLSAVAQQMLTAAGLPLKTPGRGDNGRQGTSTTPGTLVANVAQQTYFVDVATKAILPAWRQAGGPFALVFWSRDPDGTQHFQGDSLNQLTPGINGPTSRAGIRNADDDLARLEATLDALGLTATTDIIVAADHGFSTISKQSETSPSARLSIQDVPAGLLPPGFLGLDLAAALQWPLFDPDNRNAPLASGAFTKRGSALIGPDPARPEVVVAGNGGSDLIYIPSGDRALAARVARIVAAQDYTSALFVDDTLGAIPGALPLSALNLRGAALTPTPSIVVGFRTFATGCDDPVLCAVEVCDTTMQQGQGNHGSFSRADSMNFMAAAGPDFKTRFVDAAPASNADIGQTLARLIGAVPAPHGRLVGRVLKEALSGGPAAPAAKVETRTAPSTSAGVRTVLRYQSVGDVRYFDVAGTPGRTLGLDVR